MEGRPKQTDEDSSAIRDSSHENAQSTQNNGERRHIVTSLWEWVVAAIGLLLVVGSIGFMVYEGIWGDHSPPAVRIQLDSIAATENGYLVRFRATNSGGSTAEGLTIEGQLSKDDQNVETTETTLDYLPSHSVRKGGLFFTRDPRQFELSIRALGYEEP